MTRHVRIERLRLRVPTDRATAPKHLAREVARQLAKPGIDWNGKRIESVRVRVKATGSSDSLARDVANAVRQSVRQRGEQ
jgi:hypothetical protein